METTTLKLGQAVEYRDRADRRKLALVLATPDTMPEVDERSAIVGPEAGHAHLLVLSFTGSHYAKYDVPEGDGPSTFTVI